MKSRELSAIQIRAAISKLERRIQELKVFDVEALTDHYEPEIEALDNKIDDTFVSIFGHDTVEYRRYSISILDFVPFEMIGPPLRQGIKKGIESAISKLRTSKEVLKEKLEEQGETPSGRARRALDELEIHPELLEAVGKLFEGGHFADAVENACKVLDSSVKNRSGKHELSGSKLMLNVFSPQNPTLLFNELKTDTEKSEQQGMMFLFAGAMLALRNPRAHGIVEDEPEKCLALLAFISFLMKSLDKTKRR